MTKTATLEFRSGNPEPRYQDVPLGSITMGLPNNGLDYYLDYLLEPKKGTKSHFLPLLVGMSPEETIPFLRKFRQVTLKALLSSISLVPTFLVNCRLLMTLKRRKILSEVFAYFKKPLGIKLPPYFDIVHFDQAAAIF